MIDTILLDLDGTLLRFSQDTFISAYLTELKKVFAKLGMDADHAIKAVMAGTKAMLGNDGNMLNSHRFWRVFADYLGLTNESCKAIEAECDSFYTNEFNAVKTVMMPNDISKRIVKMLASKGYNTVLATNPLFPACAVETRLNWVGLTPQDFQFITHYQNSVYCKPRLEYYREIFAKMNREPAQCLMAGNSLTEDMCISALGTETFLVTDCLENTSSVDINAYKHGTLAELEAYLTALPAIKVD